MSFEAPVLNVLGGCSQNFGEANAMLGKKPRQRINAERKLIFPFIFWPSRQNELLHTGGAQPLEPYVLAFAENAFPATASMLMQSLCLKLLSVLP